MSQKSHHEVAASFLFGREDIIPDMFKLVLPLLPESGCEHFRAYLERHIVVDGDMHGPMARKVLQSLCGKNERRWQEASDAALSSLAARRRLWDDVVSALDASSELSDCNFTVVTPGEHMAITDKTPVPNRSSLFD